LSRKFSQRSYESQLSTLKIVKYSSIISYILLFKTLRKAKSLLEIFTSPSLPSTPMVPSLLHYLLLLTKTASLGCA